MRQKNHGVTIIIFGGGGFDANPCAKESNCDIMGYHDFYAEKGQ